MALQVFKFGGTSVNDAAAIRQVASIISAQSGSLVVVLSAMGGITDLLLGAAHSAVRGTIDLGAIETFRRRHVDAANELLPDGPERANAVQAVKASTDELASICESLKTLREPTQRVLDRTAARGERMLATLVTAFLRVNGSKAEYVDATEFLKVSAKRGQVAPKESVIAAASATKIRPHLDNGTIVVVPGFIGEDDDGHLVTLGRGGSDLTATIIAAAMQANEVTLYKEVDGIMTADPRFVPEARIVPLLHYREAGELAYYGAKVLHSRTIIPLVSHGIPLTVRSTFKPEQKGTRITGDATAGAYPVKALTAIRGQSLLSVEGKGMLGVPGIAGRTFQALAKAGLSVSVISQSSSEANICFVVPEVDSKAAVEALNEEFELEISLGLVDRVARRDGQAVIAVVGLGMKGTPGIAARTFEAIGRKQVNIEAIAQGSSELNISVVVGDAAVPDALKELHREFRLEKLNALAQKSSGEIQVCAFGLGQIGRTLLSQIMSQSPYFHEKLGIKVRIVGLADSSGVLVKRHGFSDGEIRDLCAKKTGKIPLITGARPTLAEQRSALRSLWNDPLTRPLFVDMTALETAEIIEDALEEGWHVVVANKKPMAVEQERYDALFAKAAARKQMVRYEATVGAGLPILDTLAKLSEAGDEVHTVLGCLSGTLGFLMTELEQGTGFADAVQKAYALGYTEPDPREDLSGMDVARKALILARTLGYRLNMADIRVEALFSESASHDEPATFIANLRRQDEEWRARVSQAKTKGEVLRYVARVGKDGVSVGIEAVRLDSPLGRLSGTDNQITITTKRYAANPLIVTGPGAGAEVTAAGVLNDILAIATAIDRTNG